MEVTPAGLLPSGALLSPQVPALKLSLPGGIGQHVVRMLARSHGKPCGLGSGNQVPSCQVTPTDVGTTATSVSLGFNSSEIMS